MLRSALLFLSERRGLRRWIETSGSAALLTRRFVAGRTLEREMEVCRRLNREGFLVSLDHLGEKVTSAEEAEASRAFYEQALEAIVREKLRASISVKLTQFGLNVSERVCHENVERLLGLSKALGGFVEFDMESHEYTDRTLSIVTEMHRRYGGVRGVIQAYLHRSSWDLELLCRAGVPMRLCKGAYREPPSVAFPKKAQVNESYKRLAATLLDKGVYPGFATHDWNMIQYVLDYARRQGLSKESFEFQMLYGIRRDLQRSLIAEGYRLRLYVPYGDAWYPYLMRRLAERPANLLFLAKNLFRK